MKFFTLLLVVSICGVLADSDSDSGSGSRERRSRSRLGRTHRPAPHVKVHVKASLRRDHDSDSNSDERRHRPPTRTIPMRVPPSLPIIPVRPIIQVAAAPHVFQYARPLEQLPPSFWADRPVEPASTPAVWKDNGVLKERLTWKTMDVSYPNRNERNAAIKAKKFQVENNVPTGIEAWHNKLFVTIPRQNAGVPVTLGYVDLNSKTQSPAVIPYPSMAANEASNKNQCNNIISVNRGARVDNFDRLWVMDSGRSGKDNKQICPPRIHVFDLETNEKLRMYTLSDDDWSSTSSFVNAIVDSDAGDDCKNTYMYIADQQGIIVYSWADNKSWRIDHETFKANPDNTDFNVGGVEFSWNDAGISGMALSPKNDNGFRTLYYHGVSSVDEGKVSTAVLQNKREASEDDFKIIGQRTLRSTTEVMASNGVMYFNLIDRHGVACWNSKDSYEPTYLKMVGQDDEKYIFPSDSVIDANNNLWVLTNRQPVQMYGNLNLKETNFRVMSAPVSQLDRCN